MLRILRRIHPQINQYPQITNLVKRLSHIQCEEPPPQIELPKESMERPLPSFESHANMKTIIPVFKKSTLYFDRVALKDQHGKYSYYSLGKGTEIVSKLITDALSGKTGERVVFLTPNDAYYVLTLWGIWCSGQIAVPLSPLHPADLIKYYVKDCKASLIITTPKYADLMDDVSKETKTQLIVIDDSIRRNSMYETPNLSSLICPDTVTEIGKPIEFYENRRALIIYTSGTTGNPKGVVLTHKNIQAQILSLIKAWNWTHDDCILHTLPLHHIHGIVNVLLCPLYVGAKCVMLPKFEVNSVWSNLLGINVRPEDRVNIYMGVPTIYTKLLQEYDKIFRTNTKMAEYVLQTLKQRIRLMVSGSAPLPAPIFKRWFDISGHRLLERYGMSETGMMLSNFYNDKMVNIAYSINVPDKDKDAKKEGEAKDDVSPITREIQLNSKPLVREPGYVGLPLPGVKIRLGEKLHGIEYRTLLECDGGTFEKPNIVFTYFDDEIEKLISHTEQLIANNKQEISQDNEDYPVGEILVQGDTLFKEYFGKIVETKLEFTKDGWFRTGDTAMYDPRKKLFKIMGRTSVDIIKSGGYKISSLHIETIILEHPEIKETAVVGIPDNMFGEKVAAIVVLKNDQLNSVPAGFGEWLKSKLAEYSLPRIVRVTDELPRNAMGKINKKELAKQIFPDYMKGKLEKVN
ncbi:malonate--CoA ligase ACSF3, mitochondrial [Chrysoperla carnea]|uniref:malonate--CoA ligase ACSF3, mitochondrial n=1 Tax=Chrysoperla carnea TaxID=189513 RepID=UPI001D091F99|nr:malonate--CoA ligase ACSF3, mitochondrial [Chrysoperla carnea]XP_044729599.1 malonate--CoA ligase ACSF3, mitochondrial [Chrysoperla carnea]XP_044729664.1 malonate--CoA ligase ACSF3, mitochondrial [Chrysoperla carnea]